MTPTLPHPTDGPSPATLTTVVHDWSNPTMELSTTILHAVAAAAACDPEELPVGVFSGVDPDAINSLFRPSAGTGMASLTLQVGKYDVRIDASGRITVRSVEQPLPVVLLLEPDERTSAIYREWLELEYVTLTARSTREAATIYDELCSLVIAAVDGRGTPLEDLDTVGFSCPALLLFPTDADVPPDTLDVPVTYVSGTVTRQRFLDAVSSALTPVA